MKALHEGFPNPAAFVDRWISLYGSLNPDEQVWRIEFEFAAADAYEALNPETEEPVDD